MSVQSTGMPFTHCVLEAERDRLIADYVQAYLQRVPLDENGWTHVQMVRLEVNAIKL